MVKLLLNAHPVMVKCCGRIFCLTVLIFALTTCGGEDFALRTGDLVFQTEGASEFSGAISASLASEGTSIDFDGNADSTEGIPSNEEPVYIHVGIAVVEEGKVYVLEANPRNGVVMTPWEDFIADSPHYDGGLGIKVMRLRGDFPVEEAILRAKSHLGETYDWHFLPDNGQMYCSELVYDSYLSADGSHIFTAAPMNFRDSDGNIPEFWTELFESFNEPVPEGTIGTNPNDLSRDPILEEIHRFF